MKFVALATDYDDTIAAEGRIDDATLASLRAVKQSRRALILVTGRELVELQETCRELDLFDLVVAENGALLFDPLKGESNLLAPAPDPVFVERLVKARVTPLTIGKSIVATREPYETDVLAAIRDLGLELQIIFNKGAVMVLPPGINKASGLTAALERLAIGPEQVVGVGDAENDHAFLSMCGCSAAVANALPSLKAQVDIVLDAPRGDGVTELVGRLIETDLAPFPNVGERPQPR